MPTASWPGRRSRTAPQFRITAARSPAKLRDRLSIVADNSLPRDPPQISSKTLDRVGKLRSQENTSLSREMDTDAGRWSSGPCRRRCAGAAGEPPIDRLPRYPAMVYSVPFTPAHCQLPSGDVIDRVLNESVRDSGWILLSAQGRRPPRQPPCARMPRSSPFYRCRNRTACVIFSNARSDQFLVV